ncbi:similar to abnormal cell LINeage LIN-41, heterochronic gene (Lin41) (predicted), isoform CRA_a [Rattus norvegicus]|uniref:Similar to abnormal cell LINeage LIN-41, heterochronic gene (Lin41) (Predicted), isoform CRA_a n=1 Tax=Rattus norvegicus TaxID=10116 RepID=A6I3N9_RAT|nr:similar to abnormal cell LINeage LIN-41, heterochronic gene (Lin41) (predicted), isoform CRA_a [Rattus norvegicus]
MLPRRAASTARNTCATTVSARTSAYASPRTTTSSAARRGLRPPPRRSSWGSGRPSQARPSPSSRCSRSASASANTTTTRYYICTATPAPCPSAESAHWAAMAATASPTSRTPYRTHGHSPSSCWPTPSRAARPFRSVTYLSLTQAFWSLLKDMWKVGVGRCASWGHGLETRRS